MPLRATSRFTEQRTPRRGRPTSERSLAVFLACAVAILLGGSGWAVSGRSQVAVNGEKAHSDFDLIAQSSLAVTIENPYAAEQSPRLMPEKIALEVPHLPAQTQTTTSDITPEWPSTAWTPKAVQQEQPQAVGEQTTDEQATTEGATGDDATSEEEVDEHLDSISQLLMLRLPLTSADELSNELRKEVLVVSKEALSGKPSPADAEVANSIAQSLRKGQPPITPIAAEPVEMSVAVPPLVAQTSAPYAPRFAEAYLYTPVSNDITTQVLPAVQHGCALAQRGALYAAKSEFIQVLRRIAQANDAESGTDQHSRALAEGLRALDEAADFVPDGTGLEGELDVKIAASSHRTPVVRQSRAQIAPHAAVALYHSFAQERLAAAAGGQQAGSMALYGLGKVQLRLTERGGDELIATRNAMTMFASAVAACPSNHLAANELGVLLCRNGHVGEAARLFEQSIDQAPSATSYHNLAMAQQRLGLAGQAKANQQESDRLAAWERSNGAVSRRAGVQWVSPGEMAEVAGAPTPGVPVAELSMPSGLVQGQNAPAPIPNTAPPQAPKSAWQKATEIAKSLPLPGASDANKVQAAPPAPRAVGPSAMRPNQPFMTR